MPIKTTVTYIKAQRDFALAAKLRLIDQFIFSGKSLKEATEIVSNYCAKAANRHAFEEK